MKNSKNNWKQNEDIKMSRGGLKIFYEEVVKAPIITVNKKALWSSNVNGSMPSSKSRSRMLEIIDSTKCLMSMQLRFGIYSFDTDLTWVMCATQIQHGSCEKKQQSFKSPFLNSDLSDVRGCWIKKAQYHSPPLPSVVNRKVDPVTPTESTGEHIKSP